MRLVLVYNAEAGLIAGVMDSAHKALSPSTYPCSLCAVTYGALAMKRQWRDYLQSLPMEKAFFHRADFHAAFPAQADLPLPLIALDRDARFEILLDAEALKRLDSIDALIAALDAKLS